MKVQYIYTVEVPDDKVTELQQAAEHILCKPMDIADRRIVSHVMGQVIDQLKLIAEKNIGASGPCATLIQHCCVIGIAATGEYSIRFRVLPDEPEKPAPSRNIIWN